MAPVVVSVVAVVVAVAVAVVAFSCKSANKVNDDSGPRTDRCSVVLGFQKFVSCRCKRLKDIDSMFGVSPVPIMPLCHCTSPSQRVLAYI